MLQEAHSWCFDGVDCMLTWPCRVVRSRFQPSQTESFGKKEPASLKKYFSTAKRALAYFDRIVAGEDYFFSTKSKEDSLRPEDHVSPAQEQLDVWSAAYTLAQDEIADDDEQKDDELKSRLLEFWMLLITQDTGSQRYSSPLLSFCAMLGIKPSSSCSSSTTVLGRSEPVNNARDIGEHEAFWDESEQVLTYKDTELHMDQVPTLLESEYGDCRRLIYADLMLGIKDAQSMRAWALKDSANNDTVGWNFVQHRDNQTLVKSGRDRFLGPSKRRNICVVSFLLGTVDPAKRLCVLIHVNGGQPIRESEFYEMTWRNTQRRRSVTLCHDRVIIHVKYHKGQQRTGRLKENIRFLAHPIGELHRMTVAIVKTKFASRINAFEANDDDEDAEEIDEDVRAMTKQRNHKTRTVNRAYANQIVASFGNVFDG
ncbi:hypothetical protein KC316_g7665 [Hortaea werneckii]|nr:hypothetical protein KC324_g7644 [Hortaea werneckii]KAI7582787.1 hypothetical protein KC316_g7665 [Hortaea werneckii]